MRKITVQLLDDRVFEFAVPRSWTWKYPDGSACSERIQAILWQIYDRALESMTYLSPHPGSANEEPTDD